MSLVKIVVQELVEKSLGGGLPVAGNKSLGLLFYAHVAIGSCAEFDSSMPGLYSLPNAEPS